eukprot:794729-Pelagomonas_calceolata.AAC.2
MQEAIASSAASTHMHRLELASHWRRSSAHVPKLRPVAMPQAYAIPVDTGAALKELSTTKREDKWRCP